jgi:SAM-dependent methyltransferase
LEHDKEKKRLIKPTEKAYLVDLKITDEQGNVFKNAQDKYRQINHYVEILSSLIKDSAIENLHKVVDMGSGKGYLTFALYDYLHNTLGLKTQVQGVEYRQDMVDLCNQFAQNASFDGLSFTQGTILDYEQKDISMLIALHACDTATDDAIFKGLQSDAELIVVAPCCHKQIRREIEKNKAQNELKFLTKYGIFLERQAEMVTDGIRALILEYFGYKTKVFEFISDAHTPKNVLVVGIKSGINPKRQEEILQEIAQTKAYFGIDYHHLERLTQLSL